MNLQYLLNGNDKSRRNVRIAIEYKDYLKKGIFFYSIDNKLLKKVIKLAQKYKIQENIEFNSNFINSIRINLNEYVLYHQLNSKRAKELKISWGNHIDFLKELCKQKDLKIYCWIENYEKEMMLGEDLKIIKSWRPDPGG